MWFMMAHDTVTDDDTAKLTRSISTTAYASTEYGPEIGTEADRNRLWNALDISTGLVLLSDEFVI